MSVTRNAGVLAALAAIGALFLFAPRAHAGTNKAANLIKVTESLSLTPYQDEGGTWHVGYGHKLPGKPAFDKITRAQAERWLREDMGAARRAVERLVTVPLNENETAALTSLVYNIGPGAFAESTLLDKLNSGLREAASNEFRKWIYVAGEQSGGLKTRREAERRVFLT